MILVFSGLDRLDGDVLEKSPLDTPDKQFATPEKKTVPVQYLPIFFVFCNGMAY
jgi:hypothetical protein